MTRPLGVGRLRGSTRANTFESLEPRRLLAVAAPIVRPPAGYTANSNPSEITSFGDYGYFTANDGVHGRELWRTDGTTAGTNLFFDAVPGTAGNTRILGVVSGRLLFSSTQDYRTRPGFFVTDGTTDGTHQLDDTIVPSGSFLLGITNGDLYLQRDVSGDSQVFRTDGQHPAEYLGQFDTIESERNLTSGIAFWTLRGNNHQARDFYMVSDGEEVIHADDFSYQGFIATAWVAVGDALYMSHQTGVYKYQGSSRTLVSPLSIDRSSLRAFGDHVFFRTPRVYGSDPQPASFWSVDTSSDQVTHLMSIPDDASFDFTTLSTALGREFFGISYNEQRKFEFWSTDGTMSGTTLINSYSFDDYGPARFLAELCGQAYFASAKYSNGQLSYEVVATNGSAAQIHAVSGWDDLLANIDTLAFHQPVVSSFAGNQYISIDRENRGVEYYRTDGTAANTTLLKDVNARPISPPLSVIYEFGPAGNVFAEVDLEEDLPQRVTAVLTDNRREIARVDILAFASGATIQSSAPLQPGLHEFRVYLLDKQGYRSVATTPWTVVLDPKSNPSIAVPRSAEMLQTRQAAGLAGLLSADQAVSGV